VDDVGELRLVLLGPARQSRSGTDGQIGCREEAGM